MFTPDSASDVMRWRHVLVHAALPRVVCFGGVYVGSVAAMKASARNGCFLLLRDLSIHDHAISTCSKTADSFLLVVGLNNYLDYCMYVCGWFSSWLAGVDCQLSCVGHVSFLTVFASFDRSLTVPCHC